MSVKSEIERISTNVADTYEILEGLGATMPNDRNSNNLPETVESFTPANCFFESEENGVELRLCKSTINLEAPPINLYLKTADGTKYEIGSMSFKQS